jgi:hypothetical protein
MRRENCKLKCTGGSEFATTLLPNTYRKITDEEGKARQALAK